MRRLIAFPCLGETLIGSLDSGASSRSALLIVSGGNETRTGAHRGMAALAAAVAAEGHAVLRFDRRGVGDSTGENTGFRSCGPDIAAAAAALRRESGARRIVAFGNCDAAAALALFGRGAEIDALVLANPWLVAPADDLPPPAAIRRRYAAGMRDPATWRRLLSGGVSLRKLVRGLARSLRSPAVPTGGSDILAAIHGWGPAATIVLAAGDATAIAFTAASDASVSTVDTDSHSFAGSDAADALRRHVLAALTG